MRASESETAVPIGVRIALGTYAAALALIVFWPTPVDAGARRLLKLVIETFPVLTYQHIEFGGNVVLFVPLGFLLAHLFRRSRELTLPTVIVTTVMIEGLQAAMLPDRYSTLSDVIANTAGGCLGILLAAAIEALRRRRRVRPESSPG